MQIVLFFLRVVINNVKFILGAKRPSFILPLTPYHFLLIKKRFSLISLPNIRSYSTIQEIFINQQYSPFIDNIHQHLNNGNVKDIAIFDIGANIGLFEVYLRQNFKQQLSIYSYEPAKQNFEYLSRNINSHTVPINKAVSARELGYSLSASVGDDVSLTQNTKDSGLIAVSFREEFFSSAAPIKLVKIDIEGHEYELFEENSDWLSDVNTLCVEFHDDIAGRHTSKTFLQNIPLNKPGLRMFYRDNMIWLSSINSSE